MSFEITYKPNTNKINYYFEVKIGPATESVESLMKKIFSVIGLQNPTAIQAFDNFLGQAFFKKMWEKAQDTPAVLKALNIKPGQTNLLSVEVNSEIVEKLERFGINLDHKTQGRIVFVGYKPFFSKIVEIYQYLPPVPSSPVSTWSIEDKISAVIRRAVLLLPKDVGEELLALCSLSNIAIIAGVVAVWAVLHFFGIGEIIDVLLLIVGFISLGPIAYEACRHLVEFAYKTFNAQKDKDLDEAAEHLSTAVTILGVQIVMTLLLKKAPKVFKNNPDYSPFKLSNMPKNQRPAGKWFYEPEILEARNLGHGTLGATYKYGDIEYLSALSGKMKDAVILHEKVHRWLTPKFYPLRNFRVVLNWNSYAKSFLLRYIEEALAQTIGQVGTYGFRRIFSGIKFPIKAGYVTVREIGIEVKGTLLGPVNVYGMIYNVYFTYSESE